MQRALPLRPMESPRSEGKNSKGHELGIFSIQENYFCSHRSFSFHILPSLFSKVFTQPFWKVFAQRHKENVRTHPFCRGHGPVFCGQQNGRPSLDGGGGGHDLKCACVVSVPQPWIRIGRESRPGGVHLDVNAQG